MATVKDLKDYKKELYSSQTRELEAFEKNFILIASGLLAFSVTFIKDIVKVEESTLIFFLFTGWALIIIAIALMMWAFLDSANASSELSKHVDDFLANKNKFSPDEGLDANDMKDYKLSSSVIFHAAKNRLKSMRFWAVRTFIMGVVSFSFYVGYNLVQEKEAKTKSKAKQECHCCKVVECCKPTKCENHKNDTNVSLNYYIYDVDTNDTCNCNDTLPHPPKMPAS